MVEIMTKKWMIAGLISLLLIISVFSLYLKINVLKHNQKPKYKPLEPHLLENELLTIEKAQERIPFKIIEPQYLPSYFELLGVVIREETISLLYEDVLERRIIITQWKTSMSGINPYAPHDYPGKKEVFINGTIGWFSIPGPYNLFWECSDLSISLTADLSGGREAVEHEMIKIAESMPCGCR